MHVDSLRICWIALDAGLGLELKFFDGALFIPRTKSQTKVNKNHPDDKVNVQKNFGTDYIPGWAWSYKKRHIVPSAFLKISKKTRRNKTFSYVSK